MEQSWRKNPSVSFAGTRMLHYTYVQQKPSDLPFSRFRSMAVTRLFAWLFFNVCTGAWARGNVALHRQGWFLTFIHPSRSV